MRNFPEHLFVIIKQVHPVACAYILFINTSYNGWEVFPLSFLYFVEFERWDRIF